MPLHQCIALLFVSMGFAALAALRMPRVRARLKRPLVWAGLVIVASAMSALSGLAASTGHAGTGFVTRHGWPKPYLFRFVSEHGAQTVGFELLYFAGNAMAYAAGLLALLVVSSALARPRPKP
jgi:hypothetical protein